MAEWIGLAPPGSGSLPWHDKARRRTACAAPAGDGSADAAIDTGGPRLGTGHEVLGASGGAAPTSFQAPLASVFKFQGWADKFTATPPDDVQDLCGSAGWGWKRLGAPQAPSTVRYADPDADRFVTVTKAFRLQLDWTI